MWGYKEIQEHNEGRNGKYKKLNGTSRGKNIISEMKVLLGGSNSIYTLQN